MVQCFLLKLSVIEMTAEASSGSGASILSCCIRKETFLYALHAFYASFYQTCKRRKKTELYKYLFTTSKGVQGRIKCFVLSSHLISIRTIICLVHVYHWIYTKQEAKERKYVCYSKWHLQWVFSCTQIGSSSVLMLKYELLYNPKPTLQQDCYTLPVKTF